MSPSSARTSWFRGAALGMLVALALWGLILGWLVFQRGKYTPGSTLTLAAPLPPSGAAQAAETALPTLQEKAIQSTEHAGKQERYEDIKAILLQGLANSQTPQEKAQAYRALAEAESQLGHYQLAAGYYEKLYNNEPKIKNLYLAAQANDLGANHEAAYQQYSLLKTSDDPDLQALLPMIDQRLVHIGDILRVCCKGHLPTPLPTLTPQASH